MNEKFKYLIALIVLLFSVGLIVTITIYVLNSDFTAKHMSNWTNLYIILFPLAFGSSKYLIDVYSKTIANPSSEPCKNKTEKNKKKHIGLFIFYGLTGSIAAYFSYKILILPLIILCLISIYINFKKK